MRKKSLDWTSWTSTICGALVLSSQASAVPSSLAVWSLVDDGSAGSTVGTAGDFNCDGISDLLIGDETSSTSPGSGPGAIVSQAGWVGIWFGGSALPAAASEPPDWWIWGSGEPFTFNENSKLGAASAAGDVNRDGCDDVIVSSRQGSGVGANVRVYLGAPGGPSTTWSWRRFIGSTGGEVESLASGDVNGDGTADIVAGLPEASFVNPPAPFGEPREGAVLVWLGSQFLTNTPDGTLGEDWRAESNQVDGLLGASVSAGGDVNRDGRDDILAGAPGWNGSGFTDEGKAFLWLGSPLLGTGAAIDTNTNRRASPNNKAWSMEIGGNGALAGTSVAILGDVDGDGFADMAVGAPGHDNFAVAGTSEGSVTVTRGAAAPTSDIFDWFHPGQGAGGLLGTAVASAGDVNGDGYADYLMGEPGFNVNGGSRGRAHLLLGRPTADWGPNPLPDVTYFENFTSSGTNPNSRRFGSRLGTPADWNDDGFSDVIIGSPATNGVWAYLGRGDTTAMAVAATLSGTQADALLGLGVAFAGDINHDGFTDVVAGAPNHDAGQVDEGLVTVAYGGPCGLNCAPFAELGGRETNQAGSSFGWSVAGAGDVNGDGFADVIAGAPNFDTDVICPRPLFFCPVPNSGLAQLYLGGAGGLAFSAQWSAFGSSQADSQFGYTVAGAGDVNGDGFGDVIVGAPYTDDGAAGADAGRVFLYLGSASGLSPSASWIKAGSQANARFGIDVAGAGDVNGDGFSDVIIGAVGHGATGAAFVYLGRPTSPTFPQGLWNTPIRVLTGIQADSAFGITVAAAGDLNRDGYADVAVGAPEFDDDPDFGPQLGLVSVYHGGPTGPSGTPAIQLFGDYPPVAGGRFGNGVAGAGDVNGDGFDDLVVGDQWNSLGGAGFAQGRAYVFHGSATGIASTAANRTLQDCTHDFCDFGRDVAGGGDVNGDGFGDVLVAAYGDDVPFNNAGRIFVHHGNAGRGLPVQPLQSLGFGGAARALLGATADWFDASMNLRSPAGRSRVRLEVEVETLGTNFDGAGLLTSVMLDNAIDLRTALSRFGNPGTVSIWRGRLRSLSPIFGRSRWTSLPENAAREMDVRVLPEPGLAAALVAGTLGVAQLARRRRRARLEVDLSGSRRVRGADDGGSRDAGR